MREKKRACVCVCVGGVVIVLAAYRKQNSAETGMVCKNINHIQMHPPAHSPHPTPPPPPPPRPSKLKKNDRGCIISIIRLEGCYLNAPRDKFLYPSGTCRRIDVVPTSIWRHFVALTSVRRHNDVMCLLGCLSCLTPCRERILI